ncbi:aspartate-semialdehyde dehydrogenase [Pasteurellaceae bacterium Macca]|nr:aspartate-semialdehyde dehydrogenase [Pasteurellaceae bacterium Macca]
MANLRLAIASDFLLAEKLLETLENSDLNIEQITAVELESFGEEHSLRWGAKAVPQLTLDEVDWSQFSHVLFAGKMAQAEVLAKAVQGGCIVLDLYGITALIGNVPVIVPSLNNEQIVQVRERNIVALANPQISQLLLAIKPLLDQPIDEIFVSSLLPSAYFGDEKVRELAGQTAQLLNGIPLDDEKPRVAFDVVPANVQGEEAHLPFSRAFALQIAKIVPNLTPRITFHALQVPVFYGISQMVTVQSSYPIDSQALSQQWQQQEWLTFHEERVMTAVKNGEEDEQDTALQISQLLTLSEQSVQFWSVADEQRFSLAFLAVELLREVTEY